MWSVCGNTICWESGVVAMCIWTYLKSEADRLGFWSLGFESNRNVVLLNHLNLIGKNMATYLIAFVGMFGQSYSKFMENTADSSVGLFCFTLD